MKLCGTLRAEGGSSFGNNKVKYHQQRWRGSFVWKGISSTALVPTSTAGAVPSIITVVPLGHVNCFFFFFSGTGDFSTEVEGENGGNFVGAKRT